MALRTQNKNEKDRKCVLQYLESRYEKKEKGLLGTLTVKSDAETAKGVTWW